MDELFTDVEQALDMGKSLAVEVPPEPIAPDAKPTAIADVAPSPATRFNFNPLNAPRPSEAGLPLALQSLQSALNDESDQVPDVNGDGTAVLNPPLLPGSLPPTGNIYDRLLLGVGCISIVVMLAIWLLTQESQQPVVPSATAPIGTEQTTAPAADNPFARYIDRSLRAIERKQQPNTVAIAPNGTPQASANLPSVPVPATPGTPDATGQTPSQPTGLARVYVPTYRIPPNFLPNAATPTPGNAGTPTARLPLAPAPGNQTSPVLQRTLRGVIEMGGNSAALVEINGVVQSYRIGESIGSSGWSLVEVSKNRAVFRRNGEVRSVFVDQSF